MVRIKLAHLFGMATFLLAIMILIVHYAAFKGRELPVRGVEIDIDDDVRPGQELPHRAYCKWQYFLGEDAVNCESVIAGGYIGMAYNPKMHKIVRTYYGPMKKFSVGELILTLGEPVEIKRDGPCIYLWWSDGSTTFSYANVFRPETPVLLVILGDDLVPNDAKRWRGFTNRR